MARLRRTPRARDFQHPHDPVRRLAETAQRKLRAELKGALKHLRKNVPIAEVARLIHTGQIRLAVDAALLRGHFAEVLKTPFGTIGEIFGDAGDIGARKITADFKRAGKRVRYRKAFSITKAYNPDEPRDEHGRWSGGIGGGGREIIETASTAAIRGAFHENISHLAIVYNRSDGTTRPYELWAIYEHGTRVSLAAYATETQARASRWWERLARKDVDDELIKAIGDGFDFDRFDEDTLRRLREAQDELIAELDQRARDTVASVIERGVRAGDAAAEIAANIRDTIALTDRQANAVANYRRLLEDIDQRALGRELRNKEFDDTVQDAIDTGEFLSDTAIERMVEDYADNYLDYRADTIARTESLRAANAGLRDSYRQAADRGVFPAEAVTRNWLAAIDERTCPVCMSIVENNPQGVGLDEDFQSDDGPIDDPPVHPSCRCTIEMQTNLDMLPSDETEDAVNEEA